MRRKRDLEKQKRGRRDGPTMTYRCSTPIILGGFLVPGLTERLTFQVCLSDAFRGRLFAFDPSFLLNEVAFPEVKVHVKIL